MEYIEENTTDHERAQMSRANAMGTPNDQMSLKEIYDEMWKLETKCNKEETIKTAHEKGDNKVERMTEEDWERWYNNEKKMKNERTGVYAPVSYTHLDVYKRQLQSGVPTSRARIIKKTYL